MIRSLHIEHYALIDQLDINLHSGFSVITGETGAGKSIILGAIALLLGERADLKAIKTGEKRCLIEAVFDLSNYNIGDFFERNNLDFEGDCIIRRELTSAGKSRAFINDTPVTLLQLKELGEQLIDIHSQHKNLLLGKENFQINILDILANNSDELEEYRQRFIQYKEVTLRLDEALEAAKQSHEEEDYIRFQVDQLNEVALVDGEQDGLEAEQDILAHAEEIKEKLYFACNGINSDGGENLLQGLKQCESALQSIISVFPQAEEFSSRLESCYIELKDISDEIESKADDVEYDPNRLKFISERLNTIYNLQKKHHVDTVAELLEIQTNLEEKLCLIDNSDEHIAGLELQKQVAFDSLMESAERLSLARSKAKIDLEQNIVELLTSLGMPNVRFEVEMSKRPQPDSMGIDKVVFLFSANKNVPVQNLSQIASGGEIARVMLSLKALIAGAVKLPTIIFDEIDTGVSGNIAEQMAKIMQDMGNHDRQVISITHLPQIAALGMNHYKVYKEDNLFSTSTHIVELNPSQRVEELAHMLSGSTITEAAMNNARELLKL